MKDRNLQLARSRLAWIVGLLVFWAAFGRGSRPFSLTALSVTAAEPLPRPFYLGFTSWTSGPSEKDVSETYAFITQHADIITEHIGGVPWTEALHTRVV